MCEWLGVGFGLSGVVGVILGGVGGVVGVDGVVVGLLKSGRFIWWWLRVMMVGCGCGCCFISLFFFVVCNGCNLGF